MSIPKSKQIFQVSVENFGLLEKALNEKLPTSGLMYNVVKLGQKLSETSKISVKVFTDSSPESFGEDSVAFMGVINVQGLPQNLVVFHGPKEGSSKDTILSLLSFLDWKRPNQFEGADNHFAPVVLEVAKRLGKAQEHDPICIYYMTIEHALQILQNERDEKILSDTSLRVGSLNINDAAMVEDRWVEKGEGYLQMLEASIEWCCSGGVYVSNNDVRSEKQWELVSFAVQLPFGSCHALHTELEHRRKGYGALTMKLLAQNSRMIPLVQIFTANDKSLCMNTSVGFKYLNDLNLIYFTPN